MTIDTAKLRELEAKATPAPWREEQGVIVDHDGNVLFQEHFDYERSADDEALTVFLRNNAGALLDAAERAEAAETVLRRIAETIDLSESTPITLLASRAAIFQRFAREHLAALDPKRVK